MIRSIDRIFADAAKRCGAVPTLYDPDILAKLARDGYLQRNDITAELHSYEYRVEHPWGYSMGVVQGGRDYTPPDGYVRIETVIVNVTTYTLTDAGRAEWARRTTGVSR